MTQKASETDRGTATPGDRQDWWRRVGAALRPDDPVLPSAGLPFELDGVTCHFIDHPEFDQGLLLVTLPPVPGLTDLDLHAGLLSLQLTLWAETSLLFGLDAQDGSLYAGTRIPLSPPPSPQEMASTIRARARQARGWVEQLASVPARQQEATP